MRSVNTKKNVSEYYYTEHEDWHLNIVITKVGTKLKLDVIIIWSPMKIL